MRPRTGSPPTHVFFDSPPQWPFQPKRHFPFRLCLENFVHRGVCVYLIPPGQSILRRSDPRSHSLRLYFFLQPFPVPDYPSYVRILTGFFIPFPSLGLFVLFGLRIADPTGRAQTFFAYLLKKYVFYLVSCSSLIFFLTPCIIFHEAYLCWCSFC